MPAKIAADAALEAAYDFAGWEEWMCSWGASPSTRSKRRAVGLLVARQHPDPVLVTTADLARFLGSPSFSAWTRRTYFGHLRALFGWLTQAGVIAADPTAGLRRPASPGNRPRPLTPAEAERALDTTDARLRAWLVLGMFAGLRAHETAKLHGSEVTQETLFVLGKGGKAAVLPTHPLVWELAQQYPRDGYWFPSSKGAPHIRSAQVTTTVTEYFKTLGIEGSYHRCRHAYGTNLVRSGVNLRVTQTLMRHSSLATTAAYLAVDEDEQQAAIRLLRG